MNKIGALVVVVLVSFPSIAYSQGEGPTPPAVTGTLLDEMAIHTISKQFVVLWNTKNAEGMKALLKSEAFFTNYVGTVWRSAEEATVAHKVVFATLFKNSTLTELGTEVRFVRPDVAVSHFKWSLIGGIDRITLKESGPREGYLLFVLEKDASGWKIHTAQNTDIRIAPPAPEVR